jgi:excisionase family DNA binding protein
MARTRTRIMASGVIYPPDGILPDRLGWNQACYSVDQLLILLQLSKSTIHRLLGQGKIESIQVGRRRLIPAWAVQEFIDRMEQEAIREETMHKVDALEEARTGRSRPIPADAVDTHFTTQMETQGSSEGTVQKEVVHG